MPAKHTETLLLVHLAEENFVPQFKRVFEDLGFTILHVEDNSEAYKILQKETVDLLVVDLSDDYRGGFRLCYRVKKDPKLKRIMIIALSDANQTYGIEIDARTKEERKWLNVDLLVQKPISPKNLYALIKKELAIIEGIDETELDAPNEGQREE
jgi:CheY-like chemotaxis protein